MFMQNANVAVRTDVDKLMDILKDKEKITLEEAAHKLNMSISTTQAIVDFLVEERILGIEYKFTTPYIYLAKKSLAKEKVAYKVEKPVLLSKQQFYEKAKGRNVPTSKIPNLWRKYLDNQLATLKKEFFERTKKRNLSIEKMNQLWEKYLSKL